MNATTVPALAGVAIALTAIAAATVAVVLGHITGEAFVGIVTAFGGLGAGAGIHASGVATGSNSNGSQLTKPTTTATLPSQPSA